MRHAVAFLFAFLFVAVGLVLLVPPRLCGQPVGITAATLGVACLVLAFLTALPVNARQALSTLRELWPFGRVATIPGGASGGAE